MKQILRSAALATADVLPESALHEMVRRALGTKHAALCCHRVGAGRPGDLNPTLTILPERLDALISFLLSTRRDSGRWLTVCFDDGYEDSALYIASRAPRWPDVEWIFFVCPEKVEKQAGFRWDLAEQRLLRGEPRGADTELLAPVEDPSTENTREELRAVARLPQYRLADVALCRQLQQLPNVSLGNHTNGHFCQTRLRPEQAQAEYDASIRDFIRLFGPQEHFAVPYGAPGFDFNASHVDALRARGRFLIWSTQPRPYTPDERRPGAVLPRFPIEGTRSWQQSAFFIASHTLSNQLKGPANLFPAGAE